MSQISNEITKIFQHLNHAEFFEAQYLLQELSTMTVVGEEAVALMAAEALIQVNLGNEVHATNLVAKLVNTISDNPKSTQLRILHAASLVAFKSNNMRLAQIYTDKFLDIYSSISVILQDNTTPFYGDVINIEGLLLFVEGEYLRALLLFEEAVNLHKKLNKPYAQAVALYNAGKTANALEQPSRAEILLVDALDIFREIQYLPGQLQSAEELVITFTLQKDKTARDAYLSIAEELRIKVEISHMEKLNQMHLKEMKLENFTLRKEIDNLQYQLTQKNAEINDLDNEISYLQNKVKDFHDIKTVYTNLKEQIKNMELTISQQQDKIFDLEVQLRQSHQTSIGSFTPFNEELSPKISAQAKIPTSSSLENLLLSDRLIDSIYYKLLDINSAKLRILAMQLQVSPINCQEAVRRLEEIGAVSVDSWNFASPTVSLVH